MENDRYEQQRCNYIASELATVNTTQPEYLQVAFKNPDFSPGTKWLNISQDQFKQIERILTLGDVEETDSQN